MSKKYDILIIGGGPAGSTSATILAKKGHSVALFEKEKFPRPHVGESLLPFCYPIFEELGVLREMKKRFVRKPGANFSSFNGKEQTTYCFNKVVPGEAYLSFHVRRAEFDKMLLDNSKNNGVDVFEETRVKKVDLKGGVSLQVKNKMGESEDFSAKYLIDCSGRDTFIANKIKSRKPIEDLDRIAFHSHWNINKMPDELKYGILRIVYLEGEDKKGWIWCIPNDKDRISIGVVVNNAYATKQRINLTKNGSDDWQRDLYLNELNSAEGIKKIISNSKRATEIWVNGNYSYKSDVKFGENFFLVGDSGAFIDPIFASGVFIAIKSAHLVAHALDKKIKNNDELPIKEAYDRILEAYACVGTFIDIYYNPDKLNLAEMGTGDSNQKYTGFKTAYTMVHYLLSGDFFENGGISQNF